MTSNYPAQIDNTYSLPTAIDNFTPVQGILFNNLRDAVIAIESAIGIQPASPYTNVAARFTNLENIVGNLKIIQLAGDLGGTLGMPLVIGIQGTPVSPNPPSFGQVLMGNGAGAWVPLSFAGDIAQISPTAGNITVVNINGASVPISGSLVTGNVLQVTGSSTLSYGPVNLAGGPTYVSGILPATNLPAATTSRLGIIQLAGDLSNVATAPQVVSLTGASGVINVANTGNVITWAASTSAPGLAQVTSSSLVNAHNMNISAQSTTASSSTGGDVNLNSGTGVVASGHINFNVGGTLSAFVGVNAFNLTNGLNLSWTSTSTTPVISQVSGTTGTGQLLNINAQNMTGASSTGGALSMSAGNGVATGGLLTLSSGSGATNGALNLQIGGSNAIAISNNRAITVTGSVAVRIVNPNTSPYNVDSTHPTIPDYIILCNTAPMVVNLPPPVPGRLLIIKDITGTAAANPLTLNPNASENIENLSGPYVLPVNYGVIRLTVGPTGNWWFV